MHTRYPPPLAFVDAISNATLQLSRDLLVRAIVVISRTGMSTATVSAARPSAPIIGVTDQYLIKRKMELMWGVIPRIVPSREFRGITELARNSARTLKLATAGDYILLVQGFHGDTRSNNPGVSALQI